MRPHGNKDTEYIYEVPMLSTGHEHGHLIFMYEPPFVAGSAAINVRGLLYNQHMYRTHVLIASINLFI